MVFFTNVWMMGGMEQHLLDLADGLVRRGRPVAVLCFDAPGITSLWERIRGAGVEAHELGGNASAADRMTRFRQLAFVLRVFRRCVVHAAAREMATRQFPIEVTVERYLEVLGQCAREAVGTGGCSLHCGTEAEGVA